MEKKIYASEFRREPEKGLVCVPPEETPVQQHFKEECDIHHILRRIERGGDPSVLEARQGAFVDVIDIAKSLEDALDVIDRGEAAFDLLPSEVRSRFDHDLGSFAQWLNGASKEDVAALFGEGDIGNGAEAPRRDDERSENDVTRAEGEDRKEPAK